MHNQFEKEQIDEAERSQRERVAEGELVSDKKTLNVVPSFEGKIHSNQIN